MQSNEDTQPTTSSTSIFKVVDAHHHFWDTENHQYVWYGKKHFAGDLAPISPPYLPGTYLHEANGEGRKIVATVHLEALMKGDPVQETAWLDSLAEATGLPTAIVAHASLEAEDVDDVLRRHVEASKRLRGIRQTLNWHHTRPEATQSPSADLMRQASWRRGYALLEKHGLSFDLQVYPWQMDDAAELARAFPNIPVALNHVGMPLDHPADGQWPDPQWERGLAQLAACPNVHCKLSGLMMLDANWSVSSIRPLLATAVALFGVNRCIYGSNFPVDKLVVSYDSMFSAVLSVLRDDLHLSSSELQQIFHDNAVSFYRIRDFI